MFMLNISILDQLYIFMGCLDVYLVCRRMYILVEFICLASARGAAGFGYACTRGGEMFDA